MFFKTIAKFDTFQFICGKPILPHSGALPQMRIDNSENILFRGKAQLYLGVALLGTIWGWIP